MVAPATKLIRGAWILDPVRPLARGDILIEGDRIVAAENELSSRAAEVIDACDLIAAPGLINAHTHSCQVLDQGIVPNLPLDLWMVWGVWAGIELDADDAYTAAAVGALEMLHTGCTSVLDHAVVLADDFAAQSDAIMHAYRDTGIRAAVAPILQDLDFVDTIPIHLVDSAAFPDHLGRGADRSVLLAGTEEFVRRWNDRHPRLKPMVGPSAPQRCSDELLAEVARITRDTGVGFHTHLLESKSQAVEVRRRYGGSVVDHLDRLGLLGPHSSFAHAIWLQPHEYEKLHASGSVLVHNPVSNLHTGSGIMPLQHLLKLGATVALGADTGAVSDQDMFEVTKLASTLHTLYGDFRRWPQPFNVWSMGMRGGAAATRQPVGRIEAGAKADLVLLRPRCPLHRTKERLLADLVYSARGRAVETVLVGGEVVLHDGTPTRISGADFERRAAVLRGRIYDQLQQRQETYAGVEDVLSRMLDVVAAEDTGRPLVRLVG